MVQLFITFSLLLFFLFNDTATTEIYTLSLHDALPILQRHTCIHRDIDTHNLHPEPNSTRSEEHTSELQSHLNIVCRLLLAKKKQRLTTHAAPHQCVRAYLTCSFLLCA